MVNATDRVIATVEKNYRDVFARTVEHHRLSQWNTIAGRGGSYYQCSCGVRVQPRSHPGHLIRMLDAELAATNVRV